MKQVWVLMIVMCVGAVGYGQVEEPNEIPFWPWSALNNLEGLGPNWLKSDDWTEYLFTANDRAYELDFGLARSDGGPRGANALKFVWEGEALGHHVAEALQGSFEVANTGDTNTFEDIIVMVALDANQLNSDFGLSLWTDANESRVTFDPPEDFVWYDPCALGYDTGRPSGIYALTEPSFEPVTYLFNRGWISLISLEQTHVGPGESVRVYFDFDYLQTQAVFNVYGSVNKKGVTSIYHTNRSVANPENAKEKVSTLAVMPSYLQADLDGNGLINLRDVAFLGQCMGRGGTDPLDAACAVADLDESGQVDLDDAAQLIALIQEYYLVNDPNESGL